MRWWRIIGVVVVLYGVTLGCSRVVDVYPETFCGEDFTVSVEGKERLVVLIDVQVPERLLEEVSLKIRMEGGRERIAGVLEYRFWERSPYQWLQCVDWVVQFDRIWGERYRSCSGRSLRLEIRRHCGSVGLIDRWVGVPVGCGK